MDHSTMTTIIGALDTVAAVLGGLTAFVGTVGGLIWQDRRPRQSDQARAYRSSRKAISKAAKRRAQYDAAAAEAEHALAVAAALDAPRDDEDLADDDVAFDRDDPVLLEQQRIAEQMAANAERMEKSVAAFAELVKRSGAQVGRAVLAITGDQPAVRQRHAPVAGRGVPAAHGPLGYSAAQDAALSAEDDDGDGDGDGEQDPPTGPLPTYQALVSSHPDLTYRPPRERRRDTGPPAQG